MADSGTYTEETLARRRLAMAQALLGDRKQPIRHWAEGLDELAKGAYGGYQFGKADREEQNSKESDRKAMADLLGMPYTPKVQSKTGYDAISSLLGGGDQPIAPLPPPAQMQAPIQQQPAPQPQVPQQQGQLPVEDGGFNRMDMAAGGLPVEGGGFNRMDARAGDPQIQQALLKAIYGGEAPDYNTMYGGGKFNSFADHPRQAIPINTGPLAGRGLSSTAAGAGQFLASTWDQKQKELNLPDFSPQSQDTAAWDLANQTYKQKTGGDLETDVKAGKVQQIAAALSGIWPSLPGGGQPNPATQGFGNRVTAGMQDQPQIPQGATPVQQQPPQAPPGAPNQQQASPTGERAPLNIPPNVAAFIQQAMGSNNPQMRAQAIALYQQYSAPEEYGFQTLPDGTIVKTSKKTGAVTPAYSGESKPTFGEIGTDKFGNKIHGFIDTYKKTVTPATGPAGQPIQPQGQTPQDLPTGEEFLKTLDKPEADQIRALAEGRMPIPGGFALKSPYWQRMIQQVSQFDPTFDAVNYNARASTRKDFTSGKSAANITSFNTVMQHLDTLDKSIDDLRNSNYPSWNKIANPLARNSGDTRFQEAEAKFGTARQAVSAELVRAFRGAGGNVADIVDWDKKLNSADSPVALKAAVKQALELLRGRMEAVGDQYNRGMGTTKDPIELLSPKAQEAVRRMSGETAITPVKVEQQTGTAPLPQVGAVMQGYKFKGGDPKDKNNWEQVQ